MSKYRIVNHPTGLMVREKRKFLRFWVWAWNRSEEDVLFKLLNRRRSLDHELRQLQRTIPKMEQHLAARKKALTDMGGTSPTWRSGWTVSRPAIPLREPKGKTKLKPVPRVPSAMEQLATPPRNKRR